LRCQVFRRRRIRCQEKQTENLKPHLSQIRNPQFFFCPLSSAVCRLSPSRRVPVSPRQATVPSA
jgi:hypothetical protein